MPNFKRLTSTSGAKLDVNIDTLAYIDAGVHGATLYFAAIGAAGKLVSVSVKETPDSIHAAPAPIASSSTQPAATS